MARFLFSCYILALSGNIVSGKNDTLFSHKHFGVSFDPYVSQRDGLLTTANRYSVQELVGMVSKISSEFRHLLMRPLYYKQVYVEQGHDVAEIPLAVASFNKKRTELDQPPLLLTMQFYMDSWRNGEGSGSFHLIKGLADEANRISPNTIQTLLLQNWELNTSTLNSTVQHLKYAQSIISSTSSSNKIQYKLGASLYFEDCGRSVSELEPYFTDLLPFVQVVLFEKLPNVEPFRHGLAKVVRKLIGLFENCQQKVKMVNPNLEIGFVTSWPASPHDPFAQDSDLPKFWRLLNDWASSRSNTLVILDEAFDNSYKNPPLNRMGWWHLVSGGKNQITANASGYVFETKEDAYLQSESFSRKHVWIWFDHPHLTNNDGGGHMDFLIPTEKLIDLVKTISGRFGTIVTGLTSSFNDHDTDIPKAVALFNKHHGQFGGGGQQIVKLMLQFNWEDGISSKHNGGNQSRLDRAKKLADDANLIFPDTVLAFILQEEDLDELSKDKLTTVSSRIIMRAHSQTHDYKLGLRLPFANCNTTVKKPNLQHLLSSSLPYIHFIVFDVNPALVEFESGVEKYTKVLHQRFSDCQRKIRDLAPETETGFAVWWPDTWSKTSAQDLSSLVHFWKGMNEWAVKCNSSIILSDAFDNPSKEVPLSKRGWWRQKHYNSSNYNATADPGFEEKREVEYVQIRSIAPFMTQTSNLVVRAVVVG